MSRRAIGVALLISVPACDHHPAAGKPAVSPAAPVVDASSNDLQPELVAFPSGARTLHGFLWRPQGAGPFPTIVFNHGSEFLPGPKPDEAQFFVAHGFVFFVPHRTGQGKSRDAGAYIADYNESNFDPAKLTHDLVTQTDDVMAAIVYVGTLPYVDAKHHGRTRKIDRGDEPGSAFGSEERFDSAERATDD
jgi:hypothetical protein